MIVTLTPNPSFDRTVELGGRLERGDVLRAVGETSQAGGKGINISRAAVAAEVPTLAVLPADSDDTFVLALLRDGIDTRATTPSGPIRANVTITEPDGTTTKLNSPGPEASPATLAAMQEALLSRAARADWIVLAGSLPPGAPKSWYADLVTRLRETSARVAVDTSDAPLRELVAALPAAAPDLMKPNGDELASLTGGDAKRDRVRPLRRRPGRPTAARPGGRCRAGDAGRQRRRARRRRRRLARHPTPDHGPQHRGGG